MAGSNVFSDEAVAQIQQMFREWSSREQNTRGHRARYTNPPARIKEGILDGAIAASTSNGQVEKTATMSVWAGEGANWADTTNNITVTNRSDDMSASSGTYFVVYRMSGEWRPLWANCG